MEPVGGWTREPATKPAVQKVAVQGVALTAMEMQSVRPSQAAADRLAALTARGARARSAMIHLADGEHICLIGGYELPAGFEPMQPVPMSSTLAGLVMHFRFPLTISDVDNDARVPPDAPVRAVGIRSYAGFPVRDPSGQVVGVCAVMDYQPREWDATELAAVDDGAQACTAFVAEQLAREAEQRQRRFLDTLLDSLDTGVAACDENGRLILVNRSLQDRLGLEPADEPPEQWVARMPATRPDGTPVTAGQVPLLHALSGAQVRGDEELINVADGGQRLFRVNAHPITDPNGRRLGAVSIFHDITDDRRAEDLQRALTRSKDEYLNLVGHELRSPLTVIASYLDLVSDSDPDTPLTDLLPMIAAAQRGSDRLRRLVEALLDLSALDSGHAQIEPIEINFASLIGAAVRDVQARAETKGITVTTDLPEWLPMNADPDRLTQLIATLLDNALTYTPSGGAVAVRVTATDQAAELEVSDTGVGVPAHERAHIFERFFRGAITTEQSIPGAGLGLATAQLIAERHHGTITVAPNQHRKGTTFRASLPLRPATVGQGRVGRILCS
jgi:two-component system phosphate regulon sensor histidine kinase PhoR